MKNLENLLDKNLFDKAIAFAVEKHKNQKRKGTDFPYIVHIYEVVQILQSNGADLETATIGALHDTVEDTDTTLDDIEREFGKTIRDGVDILSEYKSLPYDQRKAFQAFRLTKAPTNVKMVKCADCLSNLRAIKNDLTHCNVWEKFNAPKSSIQAHSEATIQAMAELEDFEMFKQLNNLYYEVFVQKETQNTAQNTAQNAAQKPILKDETQCLSLANSNAASPENELSKRELRYCTECGAMRRERDPDPDDWFCDDDEKYICSITNRVLSVANRPYEKQIAPKDCPLEK